MESRTSPQTPTGYPQALATGRTRILSSRPRATTIPSGEQAGRRGSERKRPEGATRSPPRSLDLHPTGRDVLLGEKCTRSSHRATRTRAIRDGPGDPRWTVSERSRVRCGRDALNLPIRPFGFLRFTPERFHVLLNSLFKVLFNFPSRYLFAIGLVVIFSLRWSLPPT